MADTGPQDAVPTALAPPDPHVVVLFGASGDLSRRKLLPGLFHLDRAGHLSDCRVVGTSLEAMENSDFRTLAREACEQFGRGRVDDADWARFERRLSWVDGSAGPVALADAVGEAEADIGEETRRLHYLSVPPSAAASVIATLGEAGLVDRSRIIMEKPFGTDLAMKPIRPGDVVRGRYEGYRDVPGVDERSQTETFIALKCRIDNWRWSGVPFFLRTGKALAEGARIISIAFREPPKSMFPEGSGVGQKGPDHLTFDLDESSRISLSYYGKRPGPGMFLDKLSMQFSLNELASQEDTLEAYERLIRDAMGGDHTLFTTADGIEQLWDVSAPMIDDPPEVLIYDRGSWGPREMHDLIAPRRWRLPFQRRWRG